MDRLTEIRQQVDREVRNGRKIKILTGVREPIARNISAYFQNLGDSKTLSAGSLSVDFISNYPHETVLNWFDSEYAFTGIDVYATSFNKKQGWTIIDSYAHKTLIYRQENLQEMIADGVIQKFLGRPDLDLSQRHNQGSNKGYAWEYGRFKFDFKPSRSFTEFFLNS